MQFPELFSRRGKLTPSISYGVSKTARSRILLVLKRHLGSLPHGYDSVQQVMYRVQQRLTERYGDFTRCPDWDIHPALHHFVVCSDEQALDFVEAIFTAMRDTAAVKLLVDEFNRVFREEGIGYELTPMSERVIKGGGSFSNGRTYDTPETTYPIIRKRGDTPQDESMTQCLHLLTDPAFKVANDQFLKAHQHYRANEWDQAIAYCGSAFESVLKAVLDKKKVAYKKEATANALIVECVRAGIFPQPYENSLIGIANVRNAMSDATHGRTPATQIVPDQKNAEHLLYVTAANIVFVSRCV
jgi:hypothetical protein